MKIFVTGATGSIGQHLVKMLAERGHTIHALVRSVEKAKAQSLNNLTYFQGDLSDKASIDKAMSGCQQVYHLAACAKVWAKHSGEFYAINVTGTVNILEAAVKHKIEKVVVTSTAGVLGPSLSNTITEDTVRELDFFNEYEGSKSMAESRVKDFVNNCNLNVVIVSPSRVYGPFLSGPASSITLMIDKYVNGKWRVYPGTGKEIGNYVYIEDVALGHILAMEKGRKGHTYLLGGENHDYISFYSKLGEASGIDRKMIRIPVWVQLTFARIQLLLAERFGKEPSITPKWISKGNYNWELSSHKAIQELGLPVTPLSEGLRKTVAYVKTIRRN